MTLSAKESLHHVISQLSEAECQQVLEYIQHLPAVPSTSFKSLVNDPTFKVPGKKSVIFQSVQPILAQGIPASRLLQEDRR